MDEKTPDKKAEKPRGKFSLKIHKLLKYSTFKIRLFTTLGLTLSFISGASLPVFMFIMSRMVFNFLDGQSMTSIIYATLILAAITFFLHGLSTIFMELVSKNQTISFRHNFFKAVIRQDMKWFNEIDSATLVTRLEENLVYIREALGSKLSQVSMFVSMLVVSISLAFYSEPKLTAVLLVWYPVIGFTIFFTSQSIVKSLRLTQKAYEEAGAVAEESTLLARMVRANNAEEKMENWYNRLINWAEKIIIKSSVFSAIGVGGIFASLFLMYSSGILYGGNIVVDYIQNNPGAKYQADRIIRVLMLIATSSFMLGQIAPLLLNVAKGIYAATDLLEIIDRVPEIDIYNPNGIKDVSIEGKIEFKNVSFSYPSSQSTVFDKISFTINAGETVALVGASGIGKSTITSLIQRFYDPSNGEILLDNNPLSAYNLQFLRSKIGLISQQPRLFSLSIKENIQLGNEKVISEEEIINVAKHAYAHDFIKNFPEKYDTPVGEGGSALSGGQKQRIAIARAILRNPLIYILDEATAALDVESERLVQQAFDNLFSEKKQTTIIVAHRLSTIKNADKILVFSRVGDKTEIVEQGNHAQLSNIPNGIYLNMMKTQMFDISNNDNESNEKSKNNEPYSLSRELSSASTTSGFNKNNKLIKKENSSFFIETLKSIFPFLEKKSKTLKKTRRLIIKSIFKHPASIISLFISSILIGLSFPSLAFIITAFMEALIMTDADGMRSKINTLGFIQLGIAAIVAVSAFIQYFNMFVAGQKLISKLRSLIFNSLMKHPISFYDNPKNSVGSISAILSAEVNLINQGYISNTGVTLQIISTFCLAFGFAFYTDWRYALSTMIPFLLLLPISMVHGKKAKHLAKASEKHNTESSAFILHETLIDISSVASYGLQDNFFSRYKKVLNIEEGSLYYDALYYGIAIAIASGGSLAIGSLSFYVGSLIIEENPEKTLNIVRSIFLLMYASRSITQNSVFTADMKKARAAEKKISQLIHNDYLETSDKIITDSQIKLNPNDLTGLISINHLKFQYNTRNIPVYKNLTFEILPGQTVALVGKSGSGKSTVVQLLEKFYDYHIPPLSYQLKDAHSQYSQKEMEDMIKIDGIPLSKISASSLRKMIGYVSQDPSIFNTTIIENIKMGKSDATIQEIHNACKAANIHNFIMNLPDQYETHTGRLGSKLSGGQKQRIAIARAIIRNPKILILDEATSALDSQGEASVQKALDEILSEKSRTSLVIAHRLSTIKNADKIVVLKAEENTGSVVAEVGTHDELIRQEGIYKGMLEASAI